jgi:hypothetical protein
METISDGVHIFGRLQGKAVDNHFIYLEISPEQDFTTFFERIEHHLCALKPTMIAF